jgi:putative nucleotidyltransferase with HDIG domain
VNVSVLGVYLAMQMGYSHVVILQHVGMGGLLHDIGKPRIAIGDGDSKDVIEKKLEAHPDEGLKLIEQQQKVPNEVKMIIAQHHERHNGTGFPKKLRGNGIYDLARIVSIANVFDELVADGKGLLVERQRAAIKRLDEDLYGWFDPQKLEKSLKILKLGV